MNQIPIVAGDITCLVIHELTGEDRDGLGAAREGPQAVLAGHARLDRPARHVGVEGGDGLGPSPA